MLISWIEPKCLQNCNYIHDDGVDDGVVDDDGDDDEDEDDVNDHLICRQSQSLESNEYAMW